MGTPCVLCQQHAKHPQWAMLMVDGRLSPQ